MPAHGLLGGAFGMALHRGALLAGWYKPHSGWRLLVGLLLAGVVAETPVKPWLFR
jgi:hypothetical protein